jgi:hypothetical protein
MELGLQKVRKVEKADALRLPLCRERRVRADVLLRKFSILCTAASGLAWLTGWLRSIRAHTESANRDVRWEMMLMSNISDYCTEGDDASVQWITEVYSSRFHELRGRCDSAQRLGSGGDGGKIVCMEQIPTHTCIVYSLGSRMDFSFEVSVREHTGCQVFTFDCTVGEVAPTEVPDGVMFYPWCVSKRDEKKIISSDLGHSGELGQFYSIETIMTILEHEKVDLLKMDIERHEVAVIEGLSPNYGPNQIVFETHLHNAYGIWNRSMTYAEWNAMWMKLESMGYQIFSFEPNPVCLCCCEWSINKQDLR